MSKIAVEVGGTFTDLIWLDAEGVVQTHKVPSTPSDPSRGVIAGIDEALKSGDIRISQLFHGSTVATNAVLERKGCRAALITTKGFRDLLELQRQLRPNIYAIAVRKPQPLIPLSRILEAAERIDAQGDVLEPLEETALASALEHLIATEKPEAIGVCLLHAYQNAAHERRILELIRALRPDLPVILSSDILPIFREYERASTTAMSAYLAPLIGRYIGKLDADLQQRAKGAALFIMQSSGGVLPGARAQGRPVDMLNSGPAAGVIAAQRIAARVGDRNVITLDIGGTSTDVCLIAEGRPGVTSESEVDGLPVGAPSIDIANAGAGGGSLAWIDGGGMLQVGPQSAGAHPGPACYGYGGEKPALTDALVELGWLRPHRFLGGRMALEPERATEALATIARPLAQTVPALAQSMIDIAAAHVSRCIRLVSVQRGHDPKGYVLYCYGGMGPMIGALAASELKIGRVVVPPHPGLFSALGLLVADLKRIYRETAFTPVSSESPARILKTFERMRQTAVTEFEAYGSAEKEIVFHYALEMRYRGQGFELIADVEPERLVREGARYLEKAFREVHHARYGTAPAGKPVEIVTYRLVAEVPGHTDMLDRLAHPQSSKAKTKIERGTIAWRGRPTECQFAWREELASGQAIPGPAIVEEPTATTLVPPGWLARLDPTGALVLTRELVP